MIFKSDVAAERRQQRVVEPGRARAHRPGEVAQDHLIRMPVGSKSIRSIVHHGRREHDEAVGIGNCGRSSLINQARDLAARLAADGRDEAKAEARLDETWQVAEVVYEIGRGSGRERGGKYV